MLTSLQGDTVSTTAAAPTNGQAKTADTTTVTATHTATDVMVQAATNATSASKTQSAEWTESASALKTGQGPNAVSTHNATHFAHSSSVPGLARLNVCSVFPMRIAVQWGSVSVLWTGAGKPAKSIPGAVMGNVAAAQARQIVTV
jgi:hypothetical protein